jgi:hypothetical protein
MHCQLAVNNNHDMFAAKEKGKKNQRHQVISASCRLIITINSLDSLFFGYFQNCTGLK